MASPATDLRRPVAVAAWVAACLGWTGACSDPDTPAHDAAAGDDTGAEPVVVAVTDANNTSLDATLTVPSFATASATDLRICWDGLARDLQCHDLDPVEDIDALALLRFGQLSPDEVGQRLRDGSLQQADLDGYLSLFPTGETCVALTDFTLLGTPVDVLAEYFEGGGTYLLVLTTGTTPGVGARMLAFLDPVEASPDTEVTFGDGCGVVTVDADLHSATPLSPPRTGPWQLDWSALTTDSQGHPLEAGRIDGLIVGYYADATIGDLEGRVLDLLTSASWLWTVDSVSGHAFDFDADWGEGVGFGAATGSSGIWLLGLTCSRCYTPAPLLLSVLEPEGD